MMISFAVLFYSTEILHHARMAPHQLKNYMDILSKTYYQLIAVPSLDNGSRNLKKSKNKPSKPYNHQKPSTTHMPTHFLILMLVHMWPSRTINPSSGIFMVSSLTFPHRRYYVKTGSGRVLVRNRRFLRRRIPLSIPTSQQQSNPAAVSIQDPPILRHSKRTK